MIRHNKPCETWTIGFLLSLLLFISACGPPQAAEIQTVEFNASAVGRDMKYNIFLPASYASSENQFPVLYLLHGLTGNFTHWAEGVIAHASDLDLIVVMPDAGNSWYVNWAQSDAGQKNNWEDFVIKDLIGHVDANYRTIARREGRAISGLSMGGYGAICLGLRHPDMFCSIGSQSGALGYATSSRRRMVGGEAAWVIWKDRLTGTPNPNIGIEGFSSQIERTPLGEIFLTAEDCDRYDPFKLVLEVPVESMPHIYLDCGTEDRLMEANQHFVKLLSEHKIPFTFAESIGEHNWDYWNRELGHALAVQMYVLQQNLKE